MRKPLLKKNYGINGRIGPAARFTWNEVRCSDGSLPMERELQKAYVKQARNLNRFRKTVARHYGVKFKDVSIMVNSWYRSPSFNQMIGGAKNSYHKKGMATDIKVFVKGIGTLKPVTVANIAESVKAFRNGGIGWYDHAHGYFTHLDHRDGASRWVNKG